MFFFLLSFAFSRELFLSLKAAPDSDCFSENGCGLNALKEKINFSDTINVLDESIVSDEAEQFLNFVNASTYKNLTIIGKNTKIISPDYSIGQSAAIYANSSSLDISGFIFSHFKIPILNGENSKFNVHNVIFEESEATAGAMIGYIYSSVSFSDVIIRNSTANSEPFIAAINSSFSFDGFEFIGNFMESKEVRASIHFMNSTLNFTSSTFTSNSMKLPLIASTVESKLYINDSTFKDNDVITFAALENSGKGTIEDSVFTNNKGNIILALNSSKCSLLNISIKDHIYQEDALLSLADTNGVVSSMSIEKSQIGCVVAASANSMKPYIDVTDLNIFDSEMFNSILTQIDGTLNINNINCTNIKSNADIAIVSHQNGNATIMKNIYLTHVSSTLPLSTALASVNTTRVELIEANFDTNAICGALFENTSILVTDSSFSQNQCFPQGNSLPLAIITSSSSDNCIIQRSKFVNNTALTGSVFFMNTTGTIEHSLFEKNQAVQGAGIVAAGMNMNVANTKFIDNQAMNIGGAVSLTEGNSSFYNCEFNGNTATEGGAFSLRNVGIIKIENCNAKRNTAENATFLNEDGGVMELHLDDTKIDDDFKVAMFLSDTMKHDFSKSKFSCRLRCQPPKIEINDNHNQNNQQKPAEKQNPHNQNHNNNENKHQNEEDVEAFEAVDEDTVLPGSNYGNKAIMLLPLVIFVFVAIIFRKFGIRGIMHKANRIFKKKGRHDL